MKITLKIPDNSQAIVVSLMYPDGARTEMEVMTVNLDNPRVGSTAYRMGREPSKGITITRG